MLQQTRVEAVRAKFEAFVQQFPDPESLADCDDDTLLCAWKGLGYYRRARSLRAGARRVVAIHGGEIPTDALAFRELPGVGDYTCGAVLSIAFDTPLPAIDGNVERVSARMLEIEGTLKTKAARVRIEAFIAELHEHARPGEINQALMELGATVCIPRRPLCDACPWRNECAAHAAGRTGELPTVTVRARPLVVCTEVGVARKDGRVLCRRIPRGEINEGQLCLPGLGVPIPAATDLGAHLVAEHGLVAEVGEVVATIRHSITRYRITIEARALHALPPDEPPGRGLSWEDPHDEALPWSTVARKVFGRVEE